MEGTGGADAISLAERVAKISRRWVPDPVATVNDCQVRVARVRGRYIRHQHPDSEEFFLVLDGELTIEMDGDRVVLGPGEAYLMPAGVYHRPVAHVETSVLLVQPRPGESVAFSKP